MISLGVVVLALTVISALAVANWPFTIMLKWNSLEDLLFSLGLVT